MTPLYHGTRAGFGRGGVLFPGSEVGKDNHDLDRNDFVYVTPDFDLAQYYAIACKGKGVARVLEVVPCSALEVDDSTIGGEEQESYRCTFARTIKVVWREDREMKSVAS